MSLQENAITTPVTPPRKGCFFYGCLTAVIVTVVIVVGIYFGARYVFNTVVDEYTQTSAVSLPALDNSKESYLRVKERVESFQELVRNGRAASLELTADEFNTFLSSYPGLEGVTEYFRVAFEGNVMKCLLSVPLDQVGVENRYLNGTATLSVAMVGGNPDVQLKAMHMGEKSLPQQAIEQFSQGNLFEQLDQKMRTKVLDILKGVDSLVVESGILRLNGVEKHQQL